MLGNILGGVLSSVGSLIGNNQDQIAAQKARDQQNDISERNIALQKEFAQNGLRWKVEDAKAAGIHPLYALGASGASFSPVSQTPVSGPSMSQTLSDVGQNIGRAVGTTRTSEEKEVAALNLASAKANLDGQVIDNQIKAKTLSQMGMTQPSFPGSDGGNFIPGQGNSNQGGLVKVNPKERAASQPGRPAQEAGWVPDVGFSRTDSGLTPVVPSSLSESLEDDLIGKFLWRIRNQIVPNFSDEGQPPRSQLPSGADRWRWHHARQEWQPEKNSAYESRKSSAKKIFDTYSKKSPYKGIKY